MEVEFNFNGRTLTIQCNEYDTIGQIFQKFAIKIGTNINSLTFLYNGDGNINRNLQINQVINNIDKNRNKMSVIVYDMNKSMISTYSNTSNNNTQFVYPNCNYQNNINNNLRMQETIKKQQEMIKNQQEMIKKYQETIKKQQEMIKMYEAQIKTLQNQLNVNTNNNNKDEIKDNKNKEEENKEETKETKEIKDPLLEDELEDKENIEDVITYLNGLDYDKYCKDMEIREALTLLKHKMDKEKEEKINAEENAQNKVTIEGVEKHDENDKTEKENITIINNNKTVLPEITNKMPEQNKVEIVDEEDLKRKEEIKKYKIAEQIAKTDQMKAVHSVNSIKKLLEREGLDKLKDQPPLKITVVKENPIANMDECQTNKLPFLHSLPLV